MQAYEFSSTVDDGVIHIPEQYKDKLSSFVKVIVFSNSMADRAVKKNFSALKLQTKGFKFNREEANER
ncbi:hypothetical protein NO1_0910 [Candidatus Termititenax aidoneus]|uniref:Uncharacterized protein n=1 Tax=Termititenax aidoneus TaxID=2218524 RepID=A0A388TBG0_TERA1|nr:hypothetical protein NO1_0910 [Candidatus Termititenax aidoneus]